MTGNTLTIRTLGTLVIELDGRPLPESLSRKAQSLLVYLACQQRPVAREILTTLLWEDSPAEQGMTNLRKTLSEVRRLLPDHLYADRQTIGLEPQANLWLDAAELAGLLPGDAPAEGEIGTVELAVTLYHGPFLADFTLPGSPDFMLWVAWQREQLQQKVINALHSLTGYCLRQRRYAEGVTYARQLTGLDPLSEAAGRTLMLLLARSGQAQAALAEYERCRERLADELGVEPTPATQTLAARIGTAVSTPPSLPTLIGSFVGREAELAQIYQHLADPSGRWLTIAGPGGVGKTRLALQTAAEWAYDFLHGVHFVSLASVDSPATLVPAIAAALNVPLSGPEPPQQQLLNYLRQKEILLLLDNCETLLTPALAEAAGLLPEILNQAPQVRLLVTSRERFNYQAERVLGLPGLPPTGEGALRLFLERAEQVRPDFKAEPENLAAIRQICRLVEGLPLGIELAAANLAGYSAQQIAAEITQTLDFLQQDEQDGRHSSLRAVFESGWQHLSAEEQRVFAALALFTGGFTSTAAAVVAGASAALLLSLVDKSMLRPERERYRLHELLRQFAAEKLALGEEAAAQARFGRYYAGFLQQEGSRLDGNMQQQALQAIEAEIDNIRAAWNWLAAQGGPAEIGPAISPLHRFYDIRGRYGEAEEIFRLAAAQWQTRADDGAGQVLLGRLLARQGFFQERLSILEAADSLQAGLALVEGHDPLEEAFALNQLGLVAYAQGDYEKAEQLYGRSLEISRRVEAAEQQAATLINLAALHREQGQYQAARQRAEESLVLLRRSGNQRQLAITLQVLGSLAEVEGAYTEAQAHFRQSLAICEQLGDKLGRAILCAGLGNIARQKDDLPDARQWGEQALALFQEIGDPWGMAISSVRLGDVALAQGDFEQARQLFQTSLAICREVGDQRGTAVSLCNLGYVAMGLGLLPKARTLFGEAIETAAAIQFLPLLLKAVTGLAQWSGRTGEVEQAVTLAAFARQHPAADDSTRELAATFLATAALELPPAVVTTAVARSGELDVTAVLALIQRPDS